LSNHKEARAAKNAQSAVSKHGDIAENASSRSPNRSVFFAITTNDNFGGALGKTLAIRKITIPEM
jgi:hypothetical protein